MNPQLKQSWVAALRSDQYKQAFGHLRVSTQSGVKHCAMGVLYDLIETRSAHPFSEEWLAPFMAEQRLASVGVTSIQQRFIASLNDHGKTFAEIADIIERDLESEENLGLTVQRELKRISEAVSKGAVPPITHNAFLSAQKFFKSPFLTSCLPAGSTLKVISTGVVNLCPA